MKCIECAPKGLKGLKWVFDKCNECDKASLVADTSFHKATEYEGTDNMADLFSNLMNK